MTVFYMKDNTGLKLVNYVALKNEDCFVLKSLGNVRRFVCIYANTLFTYTVIAVTFAK